MPTTWAPEMGIKFGGPAPQGGQGQGEQGQNPGQGSGAGNPGQWNGQNMTWDPNKGFKFG